MKTNKLKLTLKVLIVLILSIIILGVILVTLKNDGPAITGIVKFSLISVVTFLSISILAINN